MEQTLSFVFGAAICFGALAVGWIIGGRKWK